MNTHQNNALSAHKTNAFKRIVAAKHHDPFAYLGLHQADNVAVFRTYQPHASAVSVKVNDAWQALAAIEDSGMFVWENNDGVTPDLPVTLSISTGPIDNPDNRYESVDPYSLRNTISQHDLYLFNEGKLRQAYQTLGAHCMAVDGVEGVRFAVWAPNADRVSVVGNFNQWDGRRYPMRSHLQSGVWDIFIPHLTAHDSYQFEIRNRDTGEVLTKTDPYGFAFEARPSSNAKISPSHYQWKDQAWLKKRENWSWLQAPFNCYEVHLGSWRRKEGNQLLSYRELADTLVAYVKEMGYTHVELLPVAEHPLTESWGYQTTGYFAPTSRHGSPDDFRYLVDAFHQADIGVILDWVPGHFPKDDWALGRFDGSPLYEHPDPRRGEQQDWGTYIFNYARNEVRNFLLANAYFWLKEFHIDGLRVDAVASMLYLDYSRKDGEWLPNEFGGRENLDVVAFLKELNTMVGEEFLGAITIAEESTAWPMVSRPVYMGGLGFSMKWNMGWMNDSLAYFEEDPIHRQYHHDKLTFGQMYAYSENFVLPFSHDEVVHGKYALLDKMPGDHWQKMANLRLLLTYQATMPGKKLNFMGNEIGQNREWNENMSLDWHLVEDDSPVQACHLGITKLQQDLNKLYLHTKALHTLDFDREGFAWINCEDREQSIISFIRRGADNSFVIMVLNFTPIVRHDFRIGVPQAGEYKEIFNSDANYYAGSNQGNGLGIRSEPIAWDHHAQSVLLTLPPLAGIMLALKN